MTKEEFFEKYGDVKVTFSSYNKFTFTFSKVLSDGKKIVVEVGGNSDDIYRMEVSSGVEEFVRDLEPYSGSVYDGYKEVESFTTLYDY